MPALAIFRCIAAVLVLAVAFAEEGTCAAGDASCASASLVARLKENGLEQYADALVAEELTLADMPSVTDADLKELGFKMGARKKLLALFTAPTTPPALESVGAGAMWSQDELLEQAVAAKLRETARAKLKTEDEREALDHEIFEICNANPEDAVLRLRKALTKGGEPHYRDESGDTPLHYCALEGNVDSVRVLIEAGADINASNSAKTTPFAYADANGHKIVMNLLLKYGSTGSIET